VSVSRETPADASASVSRETDCGHDHRPASPLARLILLPIRAYRRFLSPALAPRCRYYPTCSAYAEEAIRELGVVRGTILAGWRLLRCNPFSNGGLDPLSERKLFRDRHLPHRTEHA
jgi:putative membrane protein insertion efficiency factor